jgi:hypothetical protein
MSLIGAGLCVLFMASVSAPAAPVIEVVAVSGDAAPDGNGEFAQHPAGFPGVGAFDYPALGDNGMAAFRTFLTNTSGGGLDDTGVYVGDGTTLTQVSRAGDSAAGDGIFNNYNPVKVNDAGVATYVGFLGGTSAGNGNNVGVYFGNGVSVTEVVRESNPAPGGDGTFSDNFNTSPGINESGQVAFRAQLNGTSGGSSNDTGIFLYSGGTLTQVAREGDAAPDGDGAISNLFSPPSINDAGQLAFYANMTGANNQAIIFYNGATLSQVARVGQAVPDNNGVFDGVSSANLNNQGHVAFQGFISGSSISGDQGLFLHDGVTLSQLVRVGDAAPDGDGTFSLTNSPAFNNADQALFYGIFTGTNSGNDEKALVIAEPGGLTMVARAGNAAPDGNGVFSDFFGYALSEGGHAAFYGTLTGTTGGSDDDAGIFLFDDALGLMQIAREGDSFLGSTIVDLGFANGNSFNDDEYSGLNAHGQVAYYFALADGRNGVAIATVPGLGELIGDLNGDGFVGIADLNIVLGNWNQNVTAGDKLLGDPSGDGFVGITDLNTVLGNWNAGTPPPEVIARVPEPGAGVVMVLSGLLLRRRAR